MTTTASSVPNNSSWVMQPENKSFFSVFFFFMATNNHCQLFCDKSPVYFPEVCPQNPWSIKTAAKKPKKTECWYRHDNMLAMTMLKSKKNWSIYFFLIGNVVFSLDLVIYLSDFDEIKSISRIYPIVINLSCNLRCKSNRKGSYGCCDWPKHTSPSLCSCAQQGGRNVELPKNQ